MPSATFQRGRSDVNVEKLWVALPVKRGPRVVEQAGHPLRCGDRCRTPDRLQVEGRACCRHEAVSRKTAPGPGFRAALRCQSAGRALRELMIAGISGGLDAKADSLHPRPRPKCARTTSLWYDPQSRLTIPAPAILDFFVTNRIG
jgi:hypothetical protein